jgi:hypothetical protein
MRDDSNEFAVQIEWSACAQLRRGESGQTELLKLERKYPTAETINLAGRGLAD